MVRQQFNLLSALAAALPLETLNFACQGANLEQLLFVQSKWDGSAALVWAKRWSAS